MHVIVRPICQPLLHVWVLVGSVIVQNQVDFKARSNRCVNALQETEELLMAMSRLTIGDNSSFQDVQGGKQRGGPMPLVIVRLSRGQSGAR